MAAGRWHSARRQGRRPGHWDAGGRWLGCRDVAGGRLSPERRVGMRQDGSRVSGWSLEPLEAG
jgi:hypothetical protein